jgi:hypothetical protein
MDPHRAGGISKSADISKRNSKNEKHHIRALEAGMPVCECRKRSIVKENLHTGKSSCRPPVLPIRCQKSGKKMAPLTRPDSRGFFGWDFAENRHFAPMLVSIAEQGQFGDQRVREGERFRIGHKINIVRFSHFLNPGQGHFRNGRMELEKMQVIDQVRTLVKRNQCPMVRNELLFV